MDLAPRTRSKGLSLCTSINRINIIPSGDVVNSWQLTERTRYILHEHLRGQIFSLDIPT